MGARFPGPSKVLAMGGTWPPKKGKPLGDLDLELELSLTLTGYTPIGNQGSSQSYSDMWASLPDPPATAGIQFLQQKDFSWKHTNPQWKVLFSSNGMARCPRGSLLIHDTQATPFFSPSPSSPLLDVQNQISLKNHSFSYNQRLKSSLSQKEMLRSLLFTLLQLTFS